MFVFYWLKVFFLGQNVVLASFHASNIFSFKCVLKLTNKEKSQQQNIFLNF
jgi:hypothetical protein